MTRSLALALLASSLLAPTAAAQGCPSGLIASEASAGHCCWPGQSWLEADARCDGAPTECGEGLRPDASACVPVGVVHVAPVAPVEPGLGLGSPLRLDTPAAPTYRRTVNHNVIGGGLALFFASYTGSILMGVFGGGLPFVIPLGSFYGPADGAVFGSVGVAFGLGQLLGIFFMIAGSNIFRRHVLDTHASLSSDGIAVRF